MSTFLDGMWTILGTGLLHGTVLALLTLLLCRTVLRNARPALISALWTVVLLKFLIPLGPEVPVSLSGALDSLWAGETQVPAQLAGTPQTGAIASATPAPSGPDLWLLGQAALLALYLLVVGYLLVTRLRHQQRHRRWAAAQAPATGRTLDIARRAARTLGLRRLPALRVSAGAPTPHIVGLFRPIVIIPDHDTRSSVGAPAHTESDAAQRAAHTLEAMLLHEFAHLRRRDTWLRAVQLVASALFFFWPVVGWVNRRIDEHREIACDQWALAHGRLSSGEYARALVAVARRMNSAHAARTHAVHNMALGGIVLGMAPTRGRKQLHSRVDALMTARHRPRLGIASGLLLGTYAIVCLGSDSGASERVIAAADECTIEPGLVEYILVTYPEADADGDGELSRDEVCAQKKRLEARGALPDDDADAPRLASTVPYDAVLASLDASTFECQACGCGLDELEIADSALQPLDKKICSQ